VIQFSVYHELVREINEKHPQLVREITTEELSPKARPRFSLGNFQHLSEENLTEEWSSPYYIWIRTDHSDAVNEIKVVSSLLHEYGHFILRSKIYPRLFGLGRYITHKLTHRGYLSFPWNWDFITRWFNVGEELGAWLISWGILWRRHLLKIAHLKYGWRCWKTYWDRLLPSSLQKRRVPKQYVEQ
jgi:hypothetical protein